MDTIIYHMPEHKPEKLLFEGYNYDDWYENVESIDKKELNDSEESADLSDMPPVEGDEEDVKEKKGNNNFNSKQTIN